MNRALEDGAERSEGGVPGQRGQAQRCGSWSEQVAVMFTSRGEAVERKWERQVC